MAKLGSGFAMNAMRIQNSGKCKRFQEGKKEAIDQAMKAEGQKIDSHDIQVIYLREFYL